MEVYDWVDRLPKASNRVPEYVEVRFKNTRKGFYQNVNGLPLRRGDIVAVEGTPGTDIGIVTLVSSILIERQIKRSCPKMNREEIKKVLRLANSTDIERWGEAISREHTTMIGARRISAELGLEMKIGDVEYQGDGMKAIFYYIADGRVDFRELIKVLFDRFRVRVEMKQIGARQEAGRIGGIGACGRELCCSAWINHFSTIGIGAARAQDISFNPQKLAGQCSKLKCCLNYEVDSYLDAKKSMPRVNAPLEVFDGSYYLVKTEPLTGTFFFSPAPNNYSIQIPISAKRVREIQAMNSRGEKPMQLQDEKTQKAQVAKAQEPVFQNIELEESLTRFDKSKGGGNKRPRNKRPAAKRQGGAQQPQQSQQPQQPQQPKQKPQNQPKPQNQEKPKANNNSEQKQGGAEGADKQSKPNKPNNRNRFRNKNNKPKQGGSGENSGAAPAAK